MKTKLPIEVTLLVKVALCSRCKTQIRRNELFMAFHSHKLCDRNGIELKLRRAAHRILPDDELLLQKCNLRSPFRNVHLTDVSTDCNNKFHTFLRNVSEWAFVTKLDR